MFVRFHTGSNKRVLEKFRFVLFNCNKRYFMSYLQLQRECVSNFINLSRVMKNDVYYIHHSSTHCAENISLLNEPTLRDFIAKSNGAQKLIYSPDNEGERVPYLDPQAWNGNNRKVYFEVYGCQMNVNDTEIVWSILQAAGYDKTNIIEEADVVLVVTCAIREGAENKIWCRLKKLTMYKESNANFKIGILGCMAERLKERLLEKNRMVDVIAGPDSYKDLPRLLAATSKYDQKCINVALSIDETYADIMPVSLNQGRKTAFLSIMRGCDNMCTYCIVPFTRGRERSRPLTSILEETRYLIDQGVKEITLLGQNVNSYRDMSEESHHFIRNKDTKEVSGFKTVYKTKKGGLRFAELLDNVSLVDPNVRIRFTSPHPKDFPDEVLHLINERKNICKHIHLPAQSGNNEVLKRMRRGYTREAYLNLVEKIKRIIPNVTLASDFIVGFCGETEEEFLDTVSLIQEVEYSVAYTFAYSMREKTTAYRRFQDDVPTKVKNERVAVLAREFRDIADKMHEKKYKGTRQLILIEGTAKRSESQLQGRTDNNLKVIINGNEAARSSIDSTLQPIITGHYICVEITDSNSQTLKGIPLFHTNLQEYYSLDASTK